MSRESIRNREMKPGGLLADHHSEGEYDKPSGKFWHFQEDMGWVRMVDEERRKRIESNLDDAVEVPSKDALEEQPDVPDWEAERGPENEGLVHFSAHEDRHILPPKQ